MSQTLLLELGCEELPARQLRKQAELLLNGLSKQLIEGGLSDASVQRRWLATPRRLAVLIEGVQSRQADRVLERKGPAEKAAFDDQGQPTQAALGFARSVGMTVDELDRLENEQGRWLFAKVHQPGKHLDELLPGWLEATVRDMAGARSMRWSDRSDKFLRPVRWIVALHGDRPVSLTLFGLEAGRETLGHRVHAPGKHLIERAEDYESVLERAFVRADFGRRRDEIFKRVRAIEHQLGLSVDSKSAEAVETGTEDHDFADKTNRELLDEVCGLIEWPVATVGSFDPDFLDVPAEALVSAMREHQKCFALYEPSGRLAPKFITIANLESTEPETMTHGFERVIRPRLADAQFFYQQDLKQPLASRLETLKMSVFHPQLGSLFDKTQRVIHLADALTDTFGAEAETCRRAAELAKCDLMTQMVGEFPELQGTMGRYYAEADNEAETVATAVESHYLPRYAGDRLPEDVAGRVLAVADRLDTLVGIFAAGQKPKGSKDPFALRRAALAVVRILDRAEINTPLRALIDQAATALADTIPVDDAVRSEVETFVQDRMQSWLSSEFAIETNTLRAVAAGSRQSIHSFKQLCRTLQHFADHDLNMPNLIAANKRVANLLDQSSTDHFGEVNDALLQIAAESSLLSEVNRVEPEVQKHMKAGHFEAALTALAELRPALDTFFEDVMVMDENPEIRGNRVALLHRVRSLFLQVADMALMGRA